MANSSSVLRDAEDFITRESWRVYLTALVVAGAIYLGCIVSPPSLMDDVDAVQAQIARNMLTSGDWVTARLDGVAYLEKAPLVYWIIAIFYKVFGVHDWAARIPIALSVMALAWLTAAFGTWAFGRRAGLYAGLCMATCIGIFLFTRILIPDVMLTFSTALAMWAFLRTLDEEEPYEPLRVNPAIEAEQVARLATLRAERDNDAVTAALDALRKAAEGTDNLLYPMREALRAKATVGEVSSALRDVWGRYQPTDRF
jgi:chromate transport protein ChrA